MTHSKFFSSFDDVADWYARTKPVLGIYHTEADDVRPIGNRRRKHERIVKISNNCYALMTYHHVNNVHFWGDRTKPVDTLRDIELVAPIVWRKHKDGTETVTIHNSDSSYSNGWYEFLRRYTPQGMWFNIQGVHTVGVNLVSGNTEKYVLPKNRYVSARIAADPSYKTYIDRGERQNKPSYAHGLTFRKTVMEGTRRVAWELISKNYNPEDGARSNSYIDKVAKAKLKPQIAAFREWLGAVMPMLTTPKTYEERQHLQNTLANLTASTLDILGVEASPKDLRYSMWGHWWERVDPRVVSHAMHNDDSPARMLLAYGFVAYNVQCRDWGVETDTESDLKRRFNTYMNKVLGLKKKRT